MGLILSSVFLAPFAFLSLVRWRFGFLAGIIYMMFGGVVSLALKPSPLPLLYKDIFFFLPCYLGFLIFGLQYMQRVHLPFSIILCLMPLVILAFLHTANPNLPNVLVPLIGLKVWLLYIPLVVIAAAAFETEGDLVKTLRLLLAFSLVPAAFGILQWILASLIGIESAMTIFYDREAAYGATQKFRQFSEFGNVYRIPSTFTFMAQFVSFLLCMMPIAYMVLRGDPSAAWRWLALLALGLYIIAGVLSGSRTALVFMPMLLILIAFLEGRVTTLVASAIFLPVFGILILDLAGIDAIKLLGFTAALAQHYTQNLVWDSVWHSLLVHPFGSGTGMNTQAAMRFAGSFRASIHESYYAKVIVEFGFPGLIALIIFFGGVIAISINTLRSIQTPVLKSYAAALTAFIILITINSAKGWVLDIDPANVLFYVYLGILFRLSDFDLQRWRRHTWAQRQMKAWEQQTVLQRGFQTRSRNT